MKEALQQAYDLIIQIATPLWVVFGNWKTALFLVGILLIYIIKRKIK